MTRGDQHPALPLCCTPHSRRELASLLLAAIGVREVPVIVPSRRGSAQWSACRGGAVR